MSQTKTQTMEKLKNRLAGCEMWLILKVRGAHNEISHRIVHYLSHRVGIQVRKLRYGRVLIGHGHLSPLLRLMIRSWKVTKVLINQEHQSQTHSEATLATL